MNYSIIITTENGDSWVDDVLYSTEILPLDYLSSIAEERSHHGIVNVIEEDTGKSILLINPF